MRNWIWLKWTPQNNVVVTDFTFCFFFFSLFHVRFVFLLFFFILVGRTCFSLRKRENHTYIILTQAISGTLYLTRENYINILHLSAGYDGKAYAEKRFTETLQFQSDKIYNKKQINRILSVTMNRYKEGAEKHTRNIKRKKKMNKRKKKLKRRTILSSRCTNDNVKNYKSIVKESST